MILQTKKYRKPRVSGTEFDGDKQERTADLLNAILSLLHIV